MRRRNAGRDVFHRKVRRDDEHPAERDLDLLAGLERE
jgi:hypothetical protein